MTSTVAIAKAHYNDALKTGKTPLITSALRRLADAQRKVTNQSYGSNANTRKENTK